MSSTSFSSMATPIVNASTSGFVAIMQLFTFLQDQFPQSLLILTLEGEPLSARRAEYGLLNLTPVEVIQ